MRAYGIESPSSVLHEKTVTDEWNSLKVSRKCKRSHKSIKVSCLVYIVPQTAAVPDILVLQKSAAIRVHQAARHRRQRLSAFQFAPQAPIIRPTRHTALAVRSPSPADTALTKSTDRIRSAPPTCQFHNTPGTLSWL